MTTPWNKTALCLAALLGMLCAPAAFAGHGRLAGWHGHRGHDRAWRGHDRGWSHHRRWGHDRGWDRDGWRYRHEGRRYVYDHDGFGHWVAGALVVGALTQLVVDATRQRVVYERRAPPVVYSRTRVVVRDAPPERAYGGGTVYADPYHTRYLGHVDDDDH